MERLPKQVLPYLENAGWFPGRQIDISIFEQALNENHFIVFNAVRNFLLEFGGLKVHFQRAGIGIDSFHFDARKAVEGVDRRWAQEEYFARLSNKKICIIGEAYTNHMTLMMCEDGEVYGGYDDLFWKIGTTGQEAIERMCLGKDFDEVK